MTQKRATATTASVSLARPSTQQPHLHHQQVPRPRFRGIISWAIVIVLVGLLSLLNEKRAASNVPTASLVQKKRSSRQPQQQLDGDACIPMPSHAWEFGNEEPFKGVNSVIRHRSREDFLNYRNQHNLTTIHHHNSHHQADNNNKKGGSSGILVQEARCYFQPRDSNKPVHLPHMMEQLYRCWSFFNGARPSGAKPVILYPRQHEKDWRQTVAGSALQQGLLAALQQRFNVTVRSYNDDRRKKKTRDSEIPSYNSSSQSTIAYGLLPEDAQALANGILLDHTNDDGEISSAQTLPNPCKLHYCSQEGEGDDERPQPRIAILNRKGSRSLSNAHQIASAIGNLLAGQKENADKNNAGERTHTSNNSHLVEIAQFEGASFAQQIAFFARTDIVISPHGAQLTGVPFMRGGGGGNCQGARAVVEIFPERYCVPAYFGSLVVNSGLNHSYVLLGDPRTTSCVSGGTFQQRTHSRAANLCPPLAPLLEAMEFLIGQWRDKMAACCQNNDMQNNNQACNNNPPA